MKTFRNVLIIFIIFGVIYGLIGWRLYLKRYAAPRKKLNDQKAQLLQQKENGQNQLAQMQNFTQMKSRLFSRSLPTNPNSARMEYQLWLSQMADFCEMKDPQVRLGNYQRGQGIATNMFQLQAQCTTEQLYRFLYEFYWTGFTHRIDSLDLQPVKGSNRLSVTMTISGLTIAKMNPQSPYPSAEELPSPWLYEKRLASGPFAAYSQFARTDLFKYAQSGFDDASFTTLTALPTIINDHGESETKTRWMIQSVGKPVVVGIGQNLQVGSFDGVVEKIDDDLVYLRQSGGYLWVLSLGDTLADAVALPNEF